MPLFLNSTISRKWDIKSAFVEFFGFGLVVLISCIRRSPQRGLPISQDSEQKVFEGGQPYICRNAKELILDLDEKSKVADLKLPSLTDGLLLNELLKEVRELRISIKSGHFRKVVVHVKKGQQFQPVLLGRGSPLHL